EVVDAHEVVRIVDVVDPGHVLVADAFDPVSAEADVVERRALDRLESDDRAAREDLLDPVAGGDRARPAHGRAEPRDLAVADASRLEIAREVEGRFAGHGVVEAIVTEFSKLVEDLIFTVLRELVDLVVDLLHVRLGTGSRNDLGTIPADLVEALLR